LGAGLQLRSRSQDRGISYFWKPIIASGNPAVIVIGVHSLDETGQDKPTISRVNSGEDVHENMLSSMIHSDMVPISDIVSYSKVTDLLTRRNRDYRTSGSADTKFEDLQKGPVILIGGLDNVWTKRLASALRYNFFASSQLESEIRDSKDPSQVWKFDNMQLATGNTRDYAIVASYFDPTIEQHVIIIAGIGKAGTVAAAEFLTSNQHLETWLAESKIPQGKNIELVLSTEILDGQPGPPHVLAGSVW
jgi:protein tyrosine phosphatase